MQGDNQISESPEKLDGAKVIKWAWSGNKPFGFLRYQNDLCGPIEIYGLAICQYEDSGDIYRFSCGKDWEVHNDSLHDSVDEAERQLSNQYKLIPAKWRIRE